MLEVESGTTASTLEYFHNVLDVHFQTLHDRRQSLGTATPVFALEHGLGEHDRRLLNNAVVAAHRERLLSRATSRWWLPLVVHAAEIGYIYDGVEFWPVYAQETPGWSDSEYERDRVRSWFEKFAQEYGGATPQGAWAATFRKIAWPITHAVLPRYLQVQLARMLYDYRTAWPSLLDDTEAMGMRLHAWSRHYGERLEKFCQNTDLLGRVAVALLVSGEDDQSPYIESTTLNRLVESLNSERQSRRWLRDARHLAFMLRTSNFRPPAKAARSIPERRTPALTDPSFLLRLERGSWHAYAVIPDLKPLQHSLPFVYEELRNSRAAVAGSREVVRSGALLYAMAPLEFSRWPSPLEPFLQLKNASSEANRLIADQCRMTGGPWWVFRRQAGAPAAEVKGKFVQPGGRYCIVGALDLTPPDVVWCEPASIAVEGVAAYSLAVPASLSTLDAKALVSAGLSVHSNLSIQPLGVTTGRWHGEGTAEWLAGEPALIRIEAGHSPQRCRLTVNGDPYYLEWPTGESELFLSIDGLAPGVHDVVVAVDDLDGQGHSTGGALSVIIRDPDAPAQGVFAGEGIRLRTSPAQPSLPELWDGRAVIEVDGPTGTSADLAILLRDGDSRQLGTTVRRTLELPVTGDDWHEIFAKLRTSNELARYYDDADVAELTISRAGVGFARLACERGFRGLRWVLTKRHDGGYAGRLIDRTDGGALTLDFLPMDRPTTVERQPAGQPFLGPARGGLLLATNGGQAASQIIPPDANQLLRIGATQPLVPGRPRSVAEVQALIDHHRRWSDAELPAHPFGVRDRQRVLQALTTAVAIMLAPGQWARFEQQISTIAPEDVDLNRAQALVGDATQHRVAAQAIAAHLWQWNTPEALLSGFCDVISPLAASAGMRDTVTGAHVLLHLARSPGDLVDCDISELNECLACVFSHPVLMRAARFAVLGTSDLQTRDVG